MSIKNKQNSLIKTIRYHVRAHYDQVQKEKAEYYMLLYGSVWSIDFTRKWYNPMRFLLGDTGKKILDPQKVVIKPIDHD